MKKTLLLFAGLSFLIFKNQAQTMTDIDRNVYHTLTIGAQMRMVENLKTTKYRNGKNITGSDDKTGQNSVPTEESTLLNTQNNNNFIHRDWKLLKDSANKIIKLRGVNLGGWLEWEAWIWGEGFKSQSTILKRISKLVGTDEANKFKETVYNKFIGESDICKISECGFNVIRVPFNSKIFDYENNPFSYKGIGWVIFDSLVSWCTKHNVYMILDMSAAPGGQTKWFISDPAPKPKDRLWNSKIKQQQTVDLWKAIARRYKNRKTIAGYDLLSEPAAKSHKQLVNFYKTIISAIRTEDTNHMVIIEGAHAASKFGFFKNLLDSDMTFSFHQYTWFGENPQKRIKIYKQLSKKFNVPIWCGEWGENKYNIIKNTLALYENPESNISGWAFWTWKKVPNYFPYLCGINKTEKWNTLIRWIHHTTRKKPSANDALTGMHEFLDAILFKNNMMDTEMMKILRKF